MALNGEYIYPALSGNVWADEVYTNTRPCVKWSVSQNKITNTSDLTLSFYFITGDGGARYDEGDNIRFYIDGTFYLYNSQGKAYTDSVNIDGYTDEYFYPNTEVLIRSHTYTDLQHDDFGSIEQLSFKVRFKSSYLTYDKTHYLDGVIDISAIERQAYITNAPNFTDEESPAVIYLAPAPELIEKLEICIAADEEGTELINYRDCSAAGTTYTFNFTEEERQKLRNASANAVNMPIWFIMRSTMWGEYYYSKVKKTLTIVGAMPSISPTVRDIKQETIALTGDANTFIRYESMAEFALNAYASKGAAIVSKYVSCGSVKIEDLDYGVIQNVESGTFNFYVADSRSLASSTSVFKNLIEYVKPTCYQSATVELGDNNSATVNLTINGNYYSGSFGAVDNTYLIEWRYGEKNGALSAWSAIAKAPTLKNNTYSVNLSIENLDYTKAYVIQSRITDKLNTVSSTQYELRLLPIFDWGENDFNFNVPVNITEELSLNNEVVLRHNKEANNTVISASGGHIYLRPGGTDSTYGETVIYPNGDIDIGGAINFDSFKIGGNTLADYVIEAGETAMGSNGTWYWRKWASGKAECWGCRNFGNMAVNTSWGNLYRSAILEQELPDDVFITTPDVIDINIVNANFGGWICKHENSAPSAITTGSFIYVRPASATVSPTYIGFYIIGLWKW